MPRKNQTWSREETLLAFGLYCRLPFGQLHQHNPEVNRLSQILGRTPSAVAMKACNFASLDDAHQSRGVSGLGNRAALVDQVWAEFRQDSAAIADEIERHIRSDKSMLQDAEINVPSGPTESLAVVKARRVQAFFRNAVLTSYESRCALTGLSEPSLLNASHIMPWSASESERANPANGICLSALHDRAFDRGLMTFDSDLRAVLSPRIRDHSTLGMLNDSFRMVEGRLIQLPTRFAPNPLFLEYHRQNVFIAG